MIDIDLSKNEDKKPVKWNLEEYYQELFNLDNIENNNLPANPIHNIEVCNVSYNSTVKFPEDMEEYIYQFAKSVYLFSLYKQLENFENINLTSDYITTEITVGKIRCEVFIQPSRIFEGRFDNKTIRIGLQVVIRNLNEPTALKEFHNSIVNCLMKMATVS